MAAARILLVDDEIPLLQLLEKYLQRLGHQVETRKLWSESGENFSEKLHQALLAS